MIPDFMFKRIATQPVKFGLALNAMGATIIGPSGIASISGVRQSWVVYGTIAGFILIACGNFFTTLYTNGERPQPDSKTPNQPPKV